MDVCIMYTIEEFSLNNMWKTNIVNVSLFMKSQNYSWMSQHLLTIKNFHLWYMWWSTKHLVGELVQIVNYEFNCNTSYRLKGCFFSQVPNNSDTTCLQFLLGLLILFSFAGFVYLYFFLLLYSLVLLSLL